VQKLLGRRFDLFIEVFSLAVALLGLALRGLTAGYAPSGTSGRNTKRQRAAVLNTTGMYSVVRHPLYLGNFVILVGIFLFLQVWWFALIGLLAFWLYYERIMFREEEFLRGRFERAYLNWANETPVILPRLSRWRSPRELFSWKTVLRREYTGFLFVTVIFAFIENARDVIVMGERELDEAFVGLFTAGLVVYLVLRTLKRQTRMLQTE
jgi:CDP-diglyceride synthetase